MSSTGNQGHRRTRNIRRRTAIFLAAAAVMTQRSNATTFLDPGIGNIVLEADPTTGQLYIVGDNANINSYDIDSVAGLLTFTSLKQPGGFNTLTAQTVTNPLQGSSNPNEDSWGVIASGHGLFVAEAYPPSDSPAFDTIGPGMQVLDLNLPSLSAWTAGTPISDLTFSYGNGTGATLKPAVINLNSFKQWIGDGASNNWDTNTANWTNASKFSNGDAVGFDAQGTNNPLVNLVGSLQPSIVNIDTSTGGYTFQGTGAITGSGALIKSGSGTLILKNSGGNTYSAGTTISAGTLQAGTANVFSSNSAHVVLSGATLDLNGFNQTIGSLAGNGNVMLGAATLTTGAYYPAATFSGTISGSGGVTTIGGLVVFSGANSYSGPTTISSGILSVSADNNLGNTNGTVIIGNAQLLSTGTFTSNRTINLNASTSAINVSANQTLTLAGVLSGTGSLTTGGGGILKLTNANTFSGTTIVGAGTLMLGAGASLASPTILAFGTLDATALGGLTVSGAGHQLGGSGTIVGGVTIGNAGAISQNVNGLARTLTINGGLAFVGSNTISSSATGLNATSGPSVNELIFVNGNLALSGSTTVSLANAALNKTYDLINFTGNLTGSLANLFYKPPAGATAVFSSPNPNEIDLTLTSTNSSGSKHWLGDGASNNWDVNTSPNWTGGAKFLNGDTVAFDSQGTNNPLVNLSGALQPANITVDTSTGGYTFQGTGSITSGTLTKSGPGTLVLNNTGRNTYTGQTTVNGGTLRAGMANVFSSNSAHVIAAGATLDLNNFNQSILSLAGGGNVTLGSATLTTVSGESSFTTFSGTISGSGGLTKMGAGELDLLAANTYSGPTTISGGRLSVAADNCLGDPASSVIINAGTLVAATNFSSPRAINLNSSASAINVSEGRTLTLAGVLSGTGSLNTAGGILMLTNANTYSGTTTIATGSTLVLGSGASLASPKIVVSGKLDATAIGGLSVSGASHQLTGSGVVVGGVTIGGGATVSPITTGGFAATLTINGNLNFTGSNTISSNVINLTGTKNLLTVNGNLALGGRTTVSLSNATLNTTYDLINFTGSMTGSFANLFYNQAGAAAIFSSPNANEIDVTLIPGGGGVAKQWLGDGASNTWDVNTSPNWTNGPTFLNGDPVIFNALGTNNSVVNLVGALQPAVVTVDTTAAGYIFQNTGSLVGSGALAKLGIGTLILGNSGGNTYTGITTINAGTLQAGMNNVFSSNSAHVVASGATLNLNNFDQSIGSLAGAGNVTLGSATLTTGVDNTSTTFSGNISGSGGVTKIGSGTLALSGPNSYTGPTTINGGVLSVSAENNLGNANGAVSIGNATLLSTATFTSSRAINLNAPTSAINVSGNQTLTLAGAISGAGGLTTGGGGTLALTNANTYSGPTTIAAGTTLMLGPAASLASPNIAVNGTLAVTGAGHQFGGSGTTVGSVTIGNGGAISQNPNGQTATLTINGNLNFVGSNTIVSSANSLISVNGDLALGGNTTVSLANAALNRTYDLINFTGKLTGSLANLFYSQPGTKGTFSSPNPNEIDVTLTSSGGGGGNLPPFIFDPGVGKVALEADPFTGKLYIVGNNANINSYEVDSAAGKLTFVSQKNHGGYNTLTAQSDSVPLPGSALGNNEDIWSVISSAAGTFVAEAYPAGDNPAFDTIGPGLQLFDLNVSGLSAWTAGTPISDLSFKYGNGTGATLTPAVFNLEAAVPEPTCLSLGGLAALGLLSRKRRR